MEVLDLVSMAGSAAAAWLALNLRTVRAEIKAELLETRRELTELQTKSLEHQREWINGSFMRAKEVSARIDHIAHLVQAHEKRLDALEKE